MTKTKVEVEYEEIIWDARDAEREEKSQARGTFSTATRLINANLRAIAHTILPGAIYPTPEPTKSETFEESEAWSPSFSAL